MRLAPGTSLRKTGPVRRAPSSGTAPRERIPGGAREGPHGGRSHQKPGRLTALSSSYPPMSLKDFCCSVLLQRFPPPALTLLAPPLEGLGPLEVAVQGLEALRLFLRLCFERSPAPSKSSGPRRTVLRHSVLVKGARLEKPSLQPPGKVGTPPQR